MKHVDNLCCRVVGLEGSAAPGSLVNWGGAVLVNGHLLINPTTGAQTSAITLDKYVKSGAVTLLPKSISIYEGWANQPLLVVVFPHRGHPFVELAIEQLGSIDEGMVASCGGSSFLTHVFRDRETFNQYGARVAEALAEAVLSGRLAVDTATIMAGIALAHDRPETNALRVAHGASEDRERAKHLALIVIKTDEGKARFLELLDQFTTLNEQSHVD